MKKLFAVTTVSVTAFLVLTTLASAQSGALGAQQGFGTFAQLINSFNNTIVKALGTLFMSGAVVAFLFGIAKFIWGIREGVEKNITDGKQFMIWGLIALFVMFSMYGIINFMRNTLIPGSDNTITIPEIKAGGGGGNGLGTAGASSNNNIDPGLGTAGPGSNNIDPGLGTAGAGTVSCTTVDANGVVQPCSQGTGATTCGIGQYPDGAGGCTTGGGVGGL